MARISAKDKGVERSLHSEGPTCGTEERGGSSPGSAGTGAAGGPPEGGGAEDVEAEEALEAREASLKNLCFLQSRACAR